MGGPSPLSDLSGNGYNGTAQGGLTAGASPSLLSGSSDTSTDFDGSNDYISTTYTTRRNLFTNPRAAVDTTGWTNTSLTTFARVASLPTTTGLPTGLDGGFHFVGDADGDNAAITIPVVSGTVYRVSFYVRLTSLTATGVLIRVVTAAPADHASSTTFTTVGGGFTRIDVSFTADATANWTVQLRQSGAGAVEGHFTAVLTEAAASVGTYFDGSGYVNDSGLWVPSAGIRCGWLGTAHASASDKGVFANGTVRTFMGLAKRDTTTDIDVLIGGSLSNPPTLRLQTGSGNVFFDALGGSGDAGETWAGAWPGIGQAVMWSLVVDEPGDAVTLYINGTAISTATHTDQWGAGHSLVIGATAGVQHFDGLMQHVAVVEGALTSVQINSLMSSRRITKRPPWV